MINFQDRQDVLDKIKWNDSMIAGEDRCGTYIYCGKCHKTEKYPCARAEDRFERGCVRVAIARRVK